MNEELPLLHVAQSHSFVCDRGTVPMLETKQ